MYHLHTATRSERLLQNFDFILITLPKRIHIDAVKFLNLKVIMINLFRANSSHGSNKQSCTHSVIKDLQAKKAVSRTIQLSLGKQGTHLLLKTGTGT